MIKLSGSRFTDIMPENLAEQPEIQALAYAVGRQVEKLLAYADGARTEAAIDAGAEKVLDLTKKIVAENHITCLMITHNMHSALAHGNRTIMMDHGKIVLDVAGEERAKLTVEDLLHQFEKVSGQEFASDKALLG